MLTICAGQAQNPDGAMTQSTVSAAELRNLLDEHRPATILDVRRPDEREWTIPGSLWIDATDAVNAGELGPLSDVTFESQPVITVCAAGNTAGRATALLRAKGVNALTLEGGMQAWSTAWNTAESSLGESRVVQVRRTGKGCLSYIVESHGEAVVIDASVEPEIYLELIEPRGWKVVAVADTHIHADHLSRAHRLAALAKAKLYLPAQERIRFDFLPLSDGGRIGFGGAELEAWSTPGHTAESTSYVLDGIAAFTGDTLFLDGVGRPDLERGRAEATARAAQLRRSIERLLTLPSRTLVLPGHTGAAVPFDGRILASTVEELRRMPLLQLSESQFVEAIAQHLPPEPPNHSQIVAANELGRWPDDWKDLEAGANRCAAR